MDTGEKKEAQTSHKTMIPRCAVLSVEDEKNDGRKERKGREEGMKRRWEDEDEIPSLPIKAARGFSALPPSPLPDVGPSFP